MALMTWPLTSDGAGAVTYTANEWRTLLTNLFTEGILGAGSFAVTQRAAGANMQLDIAAGVAVLTGDNAAGQGRYLIRDDAADTEAVTISTANPTNPRIDRVGIQLRDPSEGGSAGRDAIFSVVTGTAASSPSAPAAPDSFLTLALVSVAAGATSIVNANITDSRTHATLVHDVVGTDAVDNAAIVAGAVTLAEQATVQGCSVTRSTNQTLSASTTTDVTYTAETYDNGGFYPGSGATVTIPTGLGGLYSISYAYDTDVFGTNGVDNARLDISGSDKLTAPIGGEVGSGSMVLPLSAGATVKLQLFNGSLAGNITSAELHVYRIARTA